MGRAHQETRRKARRLKWVTALLGCLVVVGVLVTAWMARKKFAWWEKASFDGRVVRKEARVRHSGELVADDVAVKSPGGHQFFLRVAADDGTRDHEVTVEVYRHVAVGDRVIKEADSYRWRRIPASEGPAAPHTGLKGGEPPGRGRGRKSLEF